jgi:BNR repeat-like domain
MKLTLKYLFVTIITIIAFPFSAFSQNHDWRNVENGMPIYTNGYCDQPYVVILPGKKWLCVFTTGTQTEGAGGQHIVSSVSDNHGRSWTEPVNIEEPGRESASWAMPYITSFGRVYVFYDYNGDKIHALGDNKNIREDMLGWYCYRYTDDEGKSWSKRYRLNVRKTKVDYTNNWHGDVQILWGIGKPINVNDGMMFAFTKIGQYMLENSEGWYFHCSNINTERNADKLKFEMLPEGEVGVKNEAYGPVNEEQNIILLNSGSLYSIHRTISGFPLESYSTNGGKSWSVPEPPVYETGIAIKTPRACPRIWKCKNGKYLFWYHNHGGKTFQSRNPAWISGGIEKNGKIVWGQPEILFYEPETGKRMSYPDLIEQDGRYWITETNKENARCHEIPAEFFNTLWQQFDADKISTKNLVHNFGSTTLSPNSRIPVKTDNITYKNGISLDLLLELATPDPEQIIFELKGDENSSIRLQTGRYGDVEVILNGGNIISQWNSDPGLLKPYGKHNITVTIDNGPKIIQFIIDGIVCNGNQSRQFGWSRYTSDMKDFMPEFLIPGKLLSRDQNVSGKLHHLRIYNRAILNTEAIGNHKYYFNEY